MSTPTDPRGPEIPVVSSPTGGNTYFVQGTERLRGTGGRPCTGTTLDSTVYGCKCLEDEHGGSFVGPT